VRERKRIYTFEYHDRRCQFAVLGRVKVFNYNGRDTLIGGFGSTHIPEMRFVENFAPIILRKLVVLLQGRFSREISEGLSSHSAQACRHLVDRESVYSR